MPPAPGPGQILVKINWLVPGTFEEYCLTDGRYATRIPDGVKDEEAGPIMCGGVTAYVACKRASAQPGEWIVMIGGGGGCGHFGIQYAKAMGLRVIAIDGGEEKGQLCKQLGAEEYLDFTQRKDLAADVLRLTTWGAHAVIVFSASPEGFAVAPSMCRPGGTVVSVGLPTDTSVVVGALPGVLARKRLNIVGSITGTLEDIAEAMDFTARGAVRPVLHRATLADVDEVCRLMNEGKILGRAVLKVAS
ncbi:hypothetical protein LTR08_000639 [Meristemomyces frigidus]|nr:hypothetical protein LTR08_000639 [Meristemomyces frigidus]